MSCFQTRMLCVWEHWWVGGWVGVCRGVCIATQEISLQSTPNPIACKYLTRFAYDVQEKTLHRVVGDSRNKELHARQ